MNTAFYQSPVFYGIIILFAINIGNAVAPFLSGAWLAIIDAVISTLTYISHDIIVNNAVADARFNSIM